MKANEFPVNWATTTELAEYFGMTRGQFERNLVELGVMVPSGYGDLLRIAPFGKRYVRHVSGLMLNRDSIESLFSAAAPTAGLAKKGDGPNRAPRGDS